MPWLPPQTATCCLNTHRTTKRGQGLWVMTRWTQGSYSYSAPSVPSPTASSSPPLLPPPGEAVMAILQSPALKTRHTKNIVPKKARENAVSRSAHPRETPADDQPRKSPELSRYKIPRPCFVFQSGPHLPTPSPPIRPFHVRLTRFAQPQRPPPGPHFPFGKGGPWPLRRHPQCGYRALLLSPGTIQGHALADWLETF